MRNEWPPVAALTILQKYGRGEIDQDQAMDALGIDHYGELVVMLSKADIPFPRLPKDQEEKLANDFVRILKEGTS